MKAIKILKTALRILAAVPCTLVLWVVYFIVGMIEALIAAFGESCGVLSCSVSLSQPSSEFLFGY